MYLNSIPSNPCPLNNLETPEKKTVTEISSPPFNSKWKVMGQAAFIGFSVFLTGVWIGGLTTRNNLLSLQAKEIQTPETLTTQLKNDNKILIDQVKALKEVWHLAQEKQVQDIKNQNEDLEKQLTSYQAVEAHHKQLSAQTSAFKEILEKKIKQRKFLCEEHFTEKTNYFNLKEETEKAYTYLTNCIHSFEPLKDVEQKFIISNRKHTAIYNNGIYIPIFMSALLPLTLIGHKSRKNELNAYREARMPLKA